MPGRIAVIDTSLLISTAAHPDKTFAIWSAVLSGEILLVTSRSALDELHDVAARPKLLEMFPYLQKNFPVFLSELLKRAEIRPDPAARFILHSDPKDSLLFNLAIEAQAFALVSFDKKHILSVSDANHPQHNELKALAPSLRLLHPRHLAAELVQEKVFRKLTEASESSRRMK